MPCFRLLNGSISQISWSQVASLILQQALLFDARAKADMNAALDSMAECKDCWAGTSTMNILVNGGAGYIVSPAVSALQRAGFSPVVFDNLVYVLVALFRKCSKCPWWWAK